jgi:hypothetical protein
MSKDREREVEEILLGRKTTEVELVKELLTLRLERHKDALVNTGCSLKRGACGELKELLKRLDKDI